MVMDSKTTSKTSCLKALLLRAWRERWSDLQWGINIKSVLPRGVSGDVYNLADCILQQAVVGAGANQLVLSYLRHSLSAHLVSHAAVLQRLSKYNQFSKVHCVFSLLEFLEGMLPGVTCCGKSEETVLATAVLSTTCWLLMILHQCKNTVHLIQKASHLLEILLTDKFYISMICLARYNDPELFAEHRKSIELSHSTTNNTASTTDSDSVMIYINKLENIDTNALCLPIKSEKWPGCLIQYWLEMKLLKNPGASTTSLAEQLRLFQRLKGFNNSRIYAELIRGSLLALYDVNQTSQESQWGAFVFLKVPYILVELSGKNDSINIVNSIEMILQHRSLLDAMDANSLCSNLEFLLCEFVKAGLISDIHKKHLLEKRKTLPSLKLTTGAVSAGIPDLIGRAEPTLNGILKTLSTDYNKLQDPLSGMLQQVLIGKSFELLCAVATVQDQLRTMVTRLIQFNECSNSGDDKARNQLFDVSFLILVAIVQNHGANAVLDVDGGKSTLFEQWVRSCMVERQRPKAPEQLLRLGDSDTIEMLLQQFNAGEADFKPTIIWQDVLFNMAGVMHEVLVAWEQGSLEALDVKRILDAVRGKMCCLPVAAAAWLCAYMRTAPQENLLKPVNMIQQLLAPPVNEEDSFRQRWLLTCEIIRKMQRDVNLPVHTKSSLHLISRQPAIEQLQTAWCVAIQRGWLDHNSAKLLHCLLDTAGTRWLVSSIIQELLKLRYKDQLQRGVDLALAAFYVDIKSCTLELLLHILPQLLFNDLQANSLLEPQLSALSNLTSCCIYAAFDADSEELNNEHPAKIPRLNNVEYFTSNRLISSLRQLLIMFEGGLQDGHITQQTYFALYLIKSLVEVKNNTNNAILAAIPPTLVSDLLRTLPELFSYSLLVHLHDVYTTSGRINMAKDICVLRNYHLQNDPSNP